MIAKSLLIRRPFEIKQEVGAKKLWCYPLNFVISNYNFMFIRVAYAKSTS